jgi:glycosyltransferase involved in cell wall biosynthesis
VTSLAGTATGREGTEGGPEAIDTGVAWELIRDGEFLVWGSIRVGARSAVLAADLGVRAGARFLDSDTHRRPVAWRYLLHSLRTIGVLVRRRPRVVFVQSPPSYAAWFAAAYARIARAALVIDAHSAAFQVRAWSWPRWIHRRVSRAAVATLVTDRHWAAQVEAAGGTAIVVPDVPTRVDVLGAALRSERFTVAVVATWSPDEPLRDVLVAAAGMPDIEVVITGRHPAGGTPAVPPNVRLTGFLPRSDYIRVLASADAVMCLTTRDHTMQRGACEAVSLSRPVITSDWPLLRDSFPIGAVFTDNTALGIAAAVRRARAEHDRLSGEVSELRERRLREWALQRSGLAALIARRLEPTSR